MKSELNLDLESVANSQLSEERALGLLARRDLPAYVLEAMARNPAVTKSRRVLLAVVAHPRTPRHVSLPIARHLYTFELMQLALAPGVAADLKLAVEDVLICRLESLSSGERLTLARRGSTRVTASLLCDAEQRVITAALDNPYLTESWIVRSLQRDDAPAEFVHAVCRHPKWSLRRDIRIVLIRNRFTPLARVVMYAHTLPSAVLAELLGQGLVSVPVAFELRQELSTRTVCNRRSPVEG